MDAELQAPKPPRTKIFVLALIFAAAAVAGTWAVMRAGRSPARYNRSTATITSEELAGNYPWLKERLEHWRLSVSAGAGLPGYADLAAFPVGNGQCFAITGLHWPLGTLSNIIGPGYQKRFGFFGNLVPWVRVNGQQVEMVEQSISWCAEAPVVIVHGAVPHKLDLDIYYCAPPGVPAIVGVVVIRNTGKTIQRNVELVLTSSLPGAEATPDGMVFSRGPVRCRIGVIGAKCTLRDDVVPSFPAGLERRVRPLQASMGVSTICQLGALPPGQSVGKLMYLAFSEKPQEEADALGRLDKLTFSIIESAHTAWQAWRRKVASIESGSSELDEWLIAQEYILLAQRSACGAFSPMHGYTFAWVRDSNGPLRFFSTIGATDLVRDHLEYHFRACAKRREIGNNVPLDLPLPRSLQQPDWTTVPVEPAEVPSFVVLQHYWYYRATGDRTLIKWHAPMLQRCIRGQALDAHFTLPFHGDETYRFPGYELFNTGHDISDWVCLETRSADSAFEFVAAAEALAEMVGRPEAASLRELAQKVRQATEKLFWQPSLGFYAPSRSDFASTVHHYPFANINLRPIWVGYAEASQARQQQNVITSIKYLLGPEGLLKSTPACGYFVGMTPGYLLYDLAELRHPAAKQALSTMLRCAEASGGLAEMLQPSGKPADAVWGLHRIRPWEGGIDADAAVHALTGYRPNAAAQRAALRPLLLYGPRMAARRLPLGALSVDVEVTETSPGRRRYVLSVHGPTPAKATIDLSIVVWGSGLQVTRVNALNTAAVEKVPGPRWPWAQEIVLRNIQVNADHPAEVIATYTPAGRLAALPAPVPFRYPPAAVPEGTKAVVITPSADKVRDAQAKFGAVFAIDTKIPWPASYLRSALLSGSRPRVGIAVLDVDKYPGAFKRPEFWDTGPGAQVLKAFQQAGGKVVRVAAPSPPPQSRAGLPAMHGTSEPTGQTPLMPTPSGRPGGKS